MSPRIAFWTSAFESRMEAVASEVTLLRRQFPQSVAWGLNHRHWARLGWPLGCCLHPRLHLAFRFATRLLQKCFHINHIFGSVGDWFYLREVRGRPTVLTAAVQAAPVPAPLLERVDRFVVEYPAGREALWKMGVPRDKVRLVYPPIDLNRFTPGPRPEGPFTVLFASSPDQESWLEARGVPALLEVAALRPRMRFELHWRPWGNSAPRVLKWIAERKLRNVFLRVSGCDDMAGRYNAAHVCVAPFVDPFRCKPTPNSILEALACGRPALVSDVVGVADLVREGKAGLVSAVDPEALADCLDRLEADWPSYSVAARRLANHHFAETHFLDGYRRIYDEVLAN